jgi:UDP-glucose 4-epimerase
MSKKIFITGGAGFIGSHLADKLAETNDVCVFDNFYRGKKGNITSEKIKIIKGDIRNFYDVKKAMKDHEIVYHLAAQPNVVGAVDNPDYTLETNIGGTLNVLKAASENKVKKFIFASSREVYGEPEYLPVDEKHPLNPKNLYGRTKAAAELLCDIYKRYLSLNITIVRMANAYGPGDSDRVIPIFLNRIKNKGDLVVFGGTQILDFIWVGDLATILAGIPYDDSYDGKVFNAGTGKGTSIIELASLIISLSKSKSKMIKKPARNFDVTKFVSDTKNLKITPVKLEEGLKKLLN